MQIEMIMDKLGPPESPINGLRRSDAGGNSEAPVSPLSGPFDLTKHYSQTVEYDSESFYDKLYGLYEMSGLNLVFNARETLLNLHVFYKEVTLRGGYYQVTKDNRWEEVSTAMKLEGIKVKIPQQLQKVYAFFLYQFEQIYFFRASNRGQPLLTGSKRKSSDSKIPQILAESEIINYHKDGSNSSVPGLSKRRQCGTIVEQKMSQAKIKPQKSFRARRVRTAYQIFIKKECERLRNSLGDKLIGQSFRFMADSAWRHLSETDRQPYIEESNRDKEMYTREIKALVENSPPVPQLEGPVPLPDQAPAIHLTVDITKKNSPGFAELQN